MRTASPSTIASSASGSAFGVAVSLLAQVLQVEVLVLQHVRELVRQRDPVRDVERLAPNVDLLLRRVVVRERAGSLRLVVRVEHVDVAADQPTARISAAAWSICCRASSSSAL